MRKRTLTEHHIQSAYFDLVRLHMPGTKLIYAVPNGANKSPAARMKFKREGLTPGVPDVNIDIPRGGYHGMRIEFKSKDGQLSKDQRKAIDQLNDQGYWVVTMRDAIEAWEATRWYLELGDR